MTLPPYRSAFQVLCLVAAAWSMGFANMIAYSFTAYDTCMWYFSTPGDHKTPPADFLLIFKAVLKHAGTCAVGAVVLTLFESIRGYLDRLQSVLQSLLARLPSGLFLLTCLLHYILLLFDKGLRLVRRDVFVIQCIEGSDFLRAARRAGRLADGRKDEIGVIADVSENVALFGRLGVLSSSLFTTTLLLLRTEMGDGIDNPISIIIVMTASSFFVSTLYVQIVTATVDACLLCYCYDNEVNDGSIRRPFFTPRSLKLLIVSYAKVVNPYRNIVQGNEMDLKGQFLDAKQRMNETLKGAERTTRGAVKDVKGAAKDLAGRADDARRFTAAASSAAMTKAAVKAETFRRPSHRGGGGEGAGTAAAEAEKEHEKEKKKAKSHHAMTHSLVKGVAKGVDVLTHEINKARAQTEMGASTHHRPSRPRVPKPASHLPGSAHFGPKVSASPYEPQRRRQSLGAPSVRLGGDRRPSGASG